jgi:D-glycero-alpha-D-manno-heptose 1-phosphate guanylyltransferase
MIASKSERNPRPEQFLILVGGLGTRLRSVISDVPKPMAPIAGKPFLWYKLMQLKHMGFRKFVFLTGYLSDRIQSYFGSGEQFGIEIEYSIESEPLGTGGALRNAQQLIKGPFFMCNGDTFLNFDPEPMLKCKHQKNTDYVMLLYEPEVKGPYGYIVLDNEDRICQFVEKPEDPSNYRYINAGIYYFTPKLFELFPTKPKFSIEKDIFPLLTQEPYRFHGVPYSGYFIDIGVPENYHQFIKDVESRKIAFEE